MPMAKPPIYLDHADLLRERPAPYRPCLYLARDRCAGALQAAGRARGLLPDRHGRARAEGREGGAGCREDPQAFTDRVSQAFRDLTVTMGFSNDDFIRTTEPRHKARLRRAVGGAGGARRDLPRRLRGLVRRSRRSLLWPGRAGRARRGEVRALRRAGGVGARALLLLPPVEVADGAAATLRPARGPP